MGESKQMADRSASDVDFSCLDFSRPQCTDRSRSWSRWRCMETGGRGNLSRARCRGPGSVDFRPPRNSAAQMVGNLVHWLLASPRNWHFDRQ